MEIKTAAQQELENAKGMSIKDILVEALEKFKGQANLAEKTCADLGVSKPTIYSWCNRYGISLDDYR